jgi:hypothetical protein
VCFVPFPDFYTASTVSSRHDFSLGFTFLLFLLADALLVAVAFAGAVHILRPHPVHPATFVNASLRPAALAIPARITTSAVVAAAASFVSLPHHLSGERIAIDELHLGWVTFRHPDFVGSPLVRNLTR